MKISGNKRFLEKLAGISEIRKAAAGGKICAYSSLKHLIFFTKSALLATRM